MLPTSQPGGMEEVPSVGFQYPSGVRQAEPEGQILDKGTYFSEPQCPLDNSGIIAPTGMCVGLGSRVECVWRTHWVAMGDSTVSGWVGRGSHRKETDPKFKA